MAGNAVSASKIASKVLDGVLVGMLTALIIVFALKLLSVGFVFRLDIGQHFYYLAESFLHGKLYFYNLPAHYANDVALWAGRAYWPLLPLPAVILMPFVALFDVWLHLPFYQVYLQLPLVVSVGWLVYAVARRQHFSIQSAAYLMVAFLCSAFIAVAIIPSYVYFSGLIAVLCIWAGIFEYLGRRRYWLIGIFMACALATRVTAGLGAVFFLLDIACRSDVDWKARRRQLAAFVAPVVTAGVLLAIYNFLRFGSIFEFGYSYQTLLTPQLAHARQYGEFGFVHLLPNLYHALLAVPQLVLRDSVSHVAGYPFLQPDVWGMSIFFTSPILWYLFVGKWKSYQDKIILFTVLLIALPILLYYGVGYVQFGYRYSLDFLPWLFWLFMRQYHLQQGELSRLVRLIILASAVLNVYLFDVFLAITARPS